VYEARMCLCEEGILFLLLRLKLRSALFLER
jgi:hypothetical protein